MEITRKNESCTSGNMCHSFAKKHKIDKSPLGRCVDKLHEDEHNETKQNYVVNSVDRSSAPKIGINMVFFLLFIRFHLSWFVYSS